MGSEAQLILSQFFNLASNLAGFVRSLTSPPKAGFLLLYLNPDLLVLPLKLLEVLKVELATLYF